MRYPSFGQYSLSQATAQKKSTSPVIAKVAQSPSLLPWTTAALSPRHDPSRITLLGNLGRGTHTFVEVLKRALAQSVVGLQTVATLLLASHLCRKAMATSETSCITSQMEQLSEGVKER